MNPTMSTNCIASGTNEHNGAIVKSRKDYYNSLPEKNVKPLWLELTRFVTPSPSSDAAIAVWRYEEMRPALLEAGEIISAGDQTGES